MAVDYQTSIPKPRLNRTVLSLEGCHSSGMVVQRDRPVNLRGRARPGAHVRIEFNSCLSESVADEMGSWQARLPAQPAGGPFTMILCSDHERIELEDVWVGEVWMCVGQSNLVWPFSYIPEKLRQQYLDLIRDHDVRLMRVPERSFADASNPLPSLQWSGFDAAAQVALPALPTLLGRLLEDRCGCKVGLMVSAVAGSRSCNWIPREAFAENPGLHDYLRAYPSDPPNYSDQLACWKEDKAAFHAANDERKRCGEPLLPLTKYIFWGPRGTRSLAYPGGAFDAMVRPFAHLAVRGIIWYQGESEAAVPDGYADRLRLMMRCWRYCWKRQSGQPELPFVLVQLPGYDGELEAANWPHLREQQEMAVSDTPGALCVPSTDIGEEAELHPSDKLAFAQRLLDPVAAISSGQQPTPAPRIEGFKLRQGGEQGKPWLQVRLSAPIVAADGFQPGFEIVDSNGCTMQAQADCMDPQHIRVALPIAPFVFKGLRYNWKPFPHGRLHDSRGLPLMPFRSDGAPPPYRGDWDRQLGLF